jgi:hypothetical protein
MENQTDPALSARTFTNNPTLTAALARLKAQQPAAIISGAEVDGSDAQDNRPPKDEPMSTAALSPDAAVAQFNRLVADILREPVSTDCKHGLHRATCSMCNAPKGRTITKMSPGAAAHKGRRRVKRTKHTRPVGWTPDARAAVPATRDHSPAVNPASNAKNDAA